MQTADTQARGRAWTELDLDCLRHNVSVLRGILPPGCALMPAVKADAYGHGAVPVARALNALGVRAFCVASAGEGAALRRAGVEGIILVLGYTPPEDFPLLTGCDLTQTVVDYAYAQALRGAGKPVRVHIAVDTGMHRLGERSDALKRIADMFSMPHLRIDGIFTHLSAADGDSARCRAFTRRQGEEFWALVARLRERGYRIPAAHLLGSYGLLNHSALGGDYARVGIALYGAHSTRADAARCTLDLRPVLSLHTRVASVRALHAGEYAGYALAFEARREMRIAALSIGYADGLPRGLSGGVGHVLICGRAAPVIGRICMDQTLVDVTQIPEAMPGAVATVIGASGAQRIDVCDVAERAGTISNEILSRLGPRLSRVVRGAAEQTRDTA